MNDMNEQIKQITGRVLDELVPETWTVLGYDKIKEIQHRTAELIVKECIAICVSNALDEMDSNGRTNSAKSAFDIKEYFGFTE